MTRNVNIDLEKLSFTGNYSINKIEGTPILKLAMQWLKDYRSQKFLTKVRHKNSSIGTKITKKLKNSKKA